MKNLYTFYLIVLICPYLNAQFAGLAIDQNAGERYGWAVDFETQEEADQRALSECEKNGGDCHVVLRFEGGCGAYVVEPGNNSLYGWGTADTRNEAENRAMQEASAIGGKNLIVRVWGCNGTALVSSEVDEISKGMYYFHYTYSSEFEKKLFITDIYYEPNIAHRSNDSWVLNSNAEEILTPNAQKFYDFADKEVYGFLGENMDKAITRTGIDWEGVNEVKYNNSALNLNLTERKQKIQKGRESILNQLKSEGYEVVNVDLN